MSCGDKMATERVHEGQPPPAVVYYPTSYSEWLSGAEQMDSLLARDHRCCPLAQVCPAPLTPLSLSLLSTADAALLHSSLFGS